MDLSIPPGPNPMPGARAVVKSPLATRTALQFSNRHIPILEFLLTYRKQKALAISNRHTLPVFLFASIRLAPHPPPSRARMGMRLLLPDSIQRNLLGLQDRICSPFPLTGTV